MELAVDLDRGPGDVRVHDAAPYAPAPHQSVLPRGSQLGRGAAVVLHLRLPLRRPATRGLGLPAGRPDHDHRVLSASAERPNARTPERPERDPSADLEYGRRPAARRVAFVGGRDGMADAQHHLRPPDPHPPAPARGCGTRRSRRPGSAGRWPGRASSACSISRIMACPAHRCSRGLSAVVNTTAISGFSSTSRSISWRPVHADLEVARREVGVTRRVGRHVRDGAERDAVGLRRARPGRAASAPSRPGRPRRPARCDRPSSPPRPGRCAGRPRSGKSTQATESLPAACTASTSAGDTGSAGTDAGRSAAGGPHRPASATWGSGVTRSTGRSRASRSGSAGIGQQGGLGAPPGGGQCELGEMQRGAAAEQHRVAVGVGDGQLAARSASNAERAVLEPPAPRLGVVDRRGPDGDVHRGARRADVESAAARLRHGRVPASGHQSATRTAPAG